MATVDPDVVIEVSGLVKDYRGLRPLRIASLTLRAGDRVAIAGLDATAAEVFVNILNGAILPDAGDVRVFGQPTAAIESDSEWLASLDRFGIVTSRAVLLEHASIEQNLALPLTLDIDPLPAGVTERVRALARRAGLDQADLDRPAGEASAATRVRIHLARALALGPRVVIFEHPTAMLDADDRLPFALDAAAALDDPNVTALAITEDATFGETLARRRLRLQPATGALAPVRDWFRWVPRSRRRAPE